jgi:hypothetical protein
MWTCGAWTGSTCFFDWLRQADAARLNRWLLGPQRELLALFLRQRLELQLCEHDQDPSSLGEGFQTLDGVIYFRARPAPEIETSPADNAWPAADDEPITTLLSQLAAADYDAYQQVMIAAQGIIPAEAEEHHYHWRNVRLAERGLVPFDEAVRIYAPLRSVPIAAAVGSAAAVGGEPAPVAALYPLSVAGALDEDLFGAALRKLPAGAVHERLQWELAALCNNLVVADRRVIREREQLTAVVRKARGFLSMGLEHLAALTGRSADEQIQHLPLMTLFRAGYTLVGDLRRRAARWLRCSWFKQRGLTLAFWDEQGLALLGGLLLKRPLCYDGRHAARPYREFASLAEVHQAHAMLDAILFIDDLCARLHPPPEPLPSAGFLTWKMLLLTLWARRCLKIANEGFDAIALESFRPFFRRLWSADGSRIRPQCQQAFIEWLAESSRLGLEPLARQSVAVFEPLFDELREELAAVRPRDLDPRLVRHFWLRRSAPTR